MSTDIEANNRKFMTYTVSINGILYDYRIPCYHFVCPQCRKSYMKPTCKDCNIDCDQEPYEYEFFNKQVYQKRMAANTGETYYYTIIGNFKNHLTQTNKPHNSISYKRIVKQLHKKCTFYYDKDNIIIKYEDNDDSDEANSVEDIDEVLNEDPIEESKVESKIDSEKLSSDVQKLIDSKPKILKVKSKEEREHDRLHDEFSKKLRMYEVKRNSKLADTFIDRQPEYEEFRDTYTRLSKFSIHNVLYYIDQVLANSELFRINSKTYEDYIDDTKDESVKAIIELAYMFIHSYVIACSNLPKVREIIKEYQKTNKKVVSEFFNEEELKHIFEKLKYEDGAREFNKKVFEEKISVKRVEDRLQYIRLFSYEVMKVE